MPRHRMPGADIAGRIDYLIRKLNPGDREYTHAEIAAGIERKTGITVTPEYIGQLRAGKISNPSMRTLAGLARFFGVPIDSFYDDEAARQVERDVELAVALRRAAAANLALRLTGLPPEGVDDVIALVNRYLGEPDEEGAPMGTKAPRTMGRARLRALWPSWTTRRPRVSRDAAGTIHSAKIEETRRDCRTLLAALGLGDRFDLATLLRAVEAYIGQPITIRPAGQPERPSATGAVYREWDRAIVEYDPACPPDQRRMSIYHELGHLIWRHQRALACKLVNAGVLERMTTCDPATLADLVGLEVRDGEIYLRDRGTRQFRGDGPLNLTELQAEVMGDEIFQRILPDDPDPLARWLEL